jgi:hypothetical protein
VHVLPKGFMRVRHFGFLVNRCRALRLPEIRAAISAESGEATRVKEAKTEPRPTFNGYPCPSCCSGRLRVRAALAPQRRDGG